MAPRRPRRPTGPPPATAPPAVTRSRKRAASKPLSKPSLTLRPPEPPGVRETDRSALSTLAAAAAAVIVISSPSPPSSSPSPPPPFGRFPRSISSDGPETQKFYRSVRASHDETQTPDVVHQWYQLHSKTSSVIEVDPDTWSDSEASSSVSSSVPSSVSSSVSRSVSSSVSRPVPQSVQKSKKKRESKAFKAVVALVVAVVIVFVVVFSESSVLELAASESFASKSFASESSASESSVSETISYSMNCQLLYEISSVHDEVLQCVNDDLNSDLDLELLSFRQKTHAKSWADDKDLTCFRVSVIVSVIWVNMKKKKRFVTYLTLLNTWQEVAFIVRVKFNADKKNLNVHLVYQYERTQSNEISVESVSTVTKMSTTQTIKLEKKRAERKDLQDSEHNWVKMLMKKLLCHDRTCKNKKNQCWITSINQHVSLNSAQMFDWSAIINQNDDMITIDTSSKNIIEIAQLTAAKSKRVAAKTMIELSFSLKTSASFNFDFDHLINLMTLEELKQQQKQQQQKQKMKKQKKKKKMNKINQKTKLKKLNKLKRSNKLRKSSSSEQSLTMQSSSSVEDDDLLKYV